MIVFLPFSELQDKKYGGKANNLAILHQQGFNVPNGFIIPAKTLENILVSILDQSSNKPDNIKNTIAKNTSAFDEVIQQAWEEAANLFGSNCQVAVRSSVNLEDGTNYSFAGQFTTALEVHSLESFRKGFFDCLLSKYNKEAIAYCQAQKIDWQDLRINIVVQEMVNADFAGVCFSVNPMDGNEKEMLIEAVKGLGEKLVQGQTTPSTYCINWYDHKISKSTQVDDVVLSEEMLYKLVDESLKIQQFFGLAQDIEWAIKGNQLYILQARPLTAIHFATNYDWTNADLKDGGVSSEITTPFMYKLYEYAFETTMSPYLKSVKIHPPYEPDKWFTQFMLFSYWNLTATKDGVKKIPGFIERDFDEDLGVQPRYKNKGHVTKISIKSAFQGIQILLAINKSIRKTIKNADVELADIDAVIAKNRQIDWNKINDAEFILLATNLVKKDFLKVEGSYFVVIYNNSNFTTLFKDLLAKKDKKNDIQYLKLITGLQNLSHLQPSFELWRISRKIRKDASATQYFSENDTLQLSSKYLNNDQIPFRSELNHFMEQFGFHSEKELNILTPNWHEQPNQVFATLLNFIKKSDDENIIIKNENQKIVFDEEFHKIKSKKLQQEVKKHRYFLWLREAYRDRSSQMYDIIRRVYLIAGKRLVNKGILAHEDDIFFVEPMDLPQLFNNEKQILTNLKNNRIIFKSFRNFERPNEIWSTEMETDFTESSESNGLKGIACSFGIIEGEVFIAKTVKDAERMPNGMIMVTQFTDPAWTVYFSKIIGLITETGGMLSHGAIISREYGIPAVLGVNNITQILKSGDKIRLNGGSGIIEII